MSTHTMIHGEPVHRFVYTHKFKKRVYKGIPDCWRRDAWYFLSTDNLRNASDDYQLKATYQVNTSLFDWFYTSTMVTTISRNYYKKKVHMNVKLIWIYLELYETISCLDSAMAQGMVKKLHFSVLYTNFFFYRQRALFNVLRAFSNYDEEVGYCQGMTNIVATILMYCEEEVIRVAFKCVWVILTVNIY